MLGVPLTCNLVKKIAPNDKIIKLKTVVKTGLLIQISGNCIAFYFTLLVLYLDSGELFQLNVPKHRHIF
jgi:hypothetical protein